MEKREQILSTLRNNAPVLKEAGVESIVLFGSIARNDDTENSDIDLTISFKDMPEGGFVYIKKIETLKSDLKKMLGRPVDIVIEPIHKKRLKEEIEKEGIIAF